MTRADPVVLEARFAVALLEARERYNLSQTDVARKMAALGWPWHPQTVQRIEAGNRKTAVSEALVLAAWLQIDLGKLSDDIDVSRCCVTCDDKPPPGFTCDTCGKSGAKC